MNRNGFSAACVSPTNEAESRSSDMRFERAWRTIQFDLQRRAVHLMRGDRSAAEELVADTALKALVYMRRMPARIRNPEGFMFVVLNHVFLDRVRHADREGRAIRFTNDLDEDHAREPVASSPPPAEIMETRQALGNIAATVERWPAEKQQLFSLKFEQELPYNVIADRLHINEALARKRVELLRKKLRKAAGETRDSHGHERAGGDFSLPSRH